MFHTARPPSAHAFRAAFSRWRDAVHRAHLLSWGARGLCFGALFSAAFATAAWASGHPGAALGVVAAVPLGAMAGAGLARRRRWDDTAVALYLDARGGSAEVITTALQATEGMPGEPGEHLRREALLALRALDRRSLPPLRARWPIAAAGLCAVALAMSFAPRAIPAAPRATADDPEAERVQIDAPEGWSAVEQLSRLSTLDEPRAERLQALSAEARRLREQLMTGTDRREAMTAAERLRAAVAAERSRQWEGAAERGVQRAAGVLARMGFEGAAQALAARDLEGLDRAMERLANAREEADRRRAQEALREAADAAAGAGAEEVAAELRAEEQLLRRRADRNRLLRALAEQIGRSEDVRRAAEHLERLPSDESARDLAEAMERALASLTPEERDRLAARIRQAMGRAAQASRAGEMDGESQAGAQESMSAEEIARRLREFAQSEGEGDASGEAQSGSLGGGVPIPMGGGGARSMQRSLDRASAGMDRAVAQLRAPGGRDEGRGGAGRGGGAGEHGGSTAAVDTAHGLRARARGAVRGSGMAGGAVQRVAGSAGGVARTLRTGALQGAAAEELRGVDRSDIPAEYREQVRTYFQP
ncbi:MAG: hypothetical protein IPF99_07480 [Deltaproteobacteria bacterium]|nr:hypothetical protein [Deltaproteobacteria bacterium]